MSEIIVESRTVFNISLPKDGNTMTILISGVANDTTMNEWGYLNVNFGGMASNNTVNNSGNVADGIDGQIDRVTVSGETNGVINGATAVTNWEFDLSAKMTDTAMLNWDSGDFSGDQIDLRVLSDNARNWTLLNLNTEGNAGNGGAFDNTAFTLYIDGGDGVALNLGETISGTETAFDGYTLKYEEDKLTFGKLAAV